MGFLTPKAAQNQLKSSAGNIRTCGHTRNGTTRATSAQVVDHGRIAFNDAINVEVASETSIRNFLVLQTANGGFDSLSRGGASPEEAHADAGSAVRNVLVVLCGNPQRKR